MSKLITVILCFCCVVLYLFRLRKFRSFSEEQKPIPFSIDVWGYYMFNGPCVVDFAVYYIILVSAVCLI